jgi:hypothetical protein
MVRKMKCQYHLEIACSGRSVLRVTLNVEVFRILTVVAGVLLPWLVMPRKTLDIAVTDFAQAIGLLVRRVRAAIASQELSLTESLVMARLAKEGPATTADLASGRHETAIDGNHCGSLGANGTASQSS